MKEYEVFLEEAEEGGYTVTVPALPGCISEGETKEEALENIKDAIQGYLFTLHKHNEPEPKVEVEIVEVAA
jgi:predicted RNase H-like HicB family nuclease